MNFPTNVINFTTKISGNTQLNLVEATDGYDVHVLSVAMQQEKDLSDTEVICNSDSVALNYGKDFPQVFMNYKCFNQTLYLDKTGNDEAFVHILYTTTTPIYPTVEITDVQASNDFSYGDMVIGVFLFFMLVIMSMGGLWNRVIGVKMKRDLSNKYQFNSPEGKGDYID